MTPREQLLQDIQHGLSEQVISRQDLENIVGPVAGNASLVASSEPAITTPRPSQPDVTAKVKNSLSVIDVLFYLAGIILFAALMTMVFQLGSDAGTARVLVSLGVGLLFWSAGYLLGHRPSTGGNDTRAGLVNSLLLTGSLSVSTGGFLVTSNLTGDTGASVVLLYATTLALLGLVHVVFDRLLRNAILINFGLVLFVASFPTAVAGIFALASTNPLPDVWGILGIITGLLFAYGGKIISLSAEGRESFKDSYESFAGFIILANIYALGLASSIAVLWEMILPLTIYLAFFISIKRRSKQFLVTGSLFLVLFLVTVSFKYFSGLGAAFCLILSALSILGTAFMATNINKKYLKQTGA